MSEMRALHAALLLLALAPAPAAAAGPAVRMGPRPAGRLPAQRPLLAPQLRAHIAWLGRVGSPPRMAAMLRDTLRAPGSTPAQLAAARLLAEAFVRPEAVPAVQELLREDEGAEPSADARRALRAVVERARRDPEGASAFRALVETLPEIDGLAALGSEDSFTSLQLGLDAFFAGQAARASEAPAPLATAAEPVDARVREGRRLWPVSWRLRKAPARPEPVPSAPADAARPSPAPADPMAETFRVSVGRNPPAATITLGELFAALDKNEISFLDKLVPRRAAPQDRVIRLENARRRVNVALVLESGVISRTKRMVWADFYESDHHPLLGKLSQKFTFARWRQARPERQIHYELPHIDQDNLQFTTYGLRLSAANEALSDETMHVYVGKQFLVTTHEKERLAVKNTLRLLADTGRYMPPREMAAFLLGDTIHRYGGVIDTLSQDFAAISAKLAKDASDGSIRADAIKAGLKIEAIHNTIIRQKHVLEDLLQVNQFHKSEYVPVDAIAQQLASLDQHLAALNHYHNQKNGLVSLHSAAVSNKLTRLTGVSAVALGLATVITGVMGMNVPLPGAESPLVFWLITGGLTAMMAGLYAFARRNRWV